MSPSLSQLPEVLDLETVQTAIHYKERRKIHTYFLATGPYRRELYPKHCAFFRAGRTHRQRGFIAGNRTGKTDAGSFEMTLHLTGEYPDWWEGRRFPRAIKAWACGENSKQLREVLQQKLLGSPGQHGTGFIPAENIRKITTKQGVAEAVDTIYVLHKSGGTSSLTLKTYQEGREAYQGGSIDAIWADEEIPAPIWDECLLRTMTTNGILWLTYTPLQGLSEITLRFLPGGKMPEQDEDIDTSKFVVMASWADCPHLPPEVQAELLQSIPEYQREARSKGIPQLGSGCIWPLSEQFFVVPDRPIPDFWPRCFGLDVGWKRTAAIWLAQDRDTGVLYAYSEHYMGKEEPAIHAHAIRARGASIPGVIDPASRGRSQRDGQTLIQAYQDLGLDIDPAISAVEAGLFIVWQLFSTGMLKVFESLANLRQEIRLYRRDADGKVVKANDHACDALRYGIVSGRDRMKPLVVPPDPNREFSHHGDGGNYEGSWMR